MRPTSAPRPRRPVRLAVLLVLGLTSPAFADDKPGWEDLSRLESWKGASSNWETVGSTALKPGDPRHLAGEAGTGVIYNGPGGRAPNLLSKKDYGDVELHVEFMVPKNSNSGVKMEGVYEVQIFDSHGVKTLTASHCGGIYPRAELLPRYHHIDKGYPPLANGCKAPGEWQSLDIVFRAPKFDAAGKKVRNATFVSVTLNGVVVQKDLELPCPTGNNWRNKEEPAGPILLQGDHGPVAFRNLKVRPLPPG